MASVSFSAASLTAGAFNDVLFDSSVDVVGGQPYVASVWSADGHFVSSIGTFSSPVGVTDSLYAWADGENISTRAPGWTTMGQAPFTTTGDVFPGTNLTNMYFVSPIWVKRRKRVTTYDRGTEGRLNDVLDVLGTTKTSLWPFWEGTGLVVSGIGVGDLSPAETAGAAEALEDDFAPLQLPCGLYSYHFNPTGDHHLAGVDHTNYSFGNGTADSAFSVGAWIRPNAVATNVIMGKYDSAGNLEEWRFWIDASGKLSLELHDASASTTEIAASTSALTIGQWVMVTATYDGTAATPSVNLYVNGALANDGTTTESGAYTAMENTAAPLTLGCSGVTALPVAEFHGRIAMPFVAGKELSAANVTTLYGYTAPMVGIA